MLSSIAWHPPAESRIPLSVILKSAGCDLAEACRALSDLTGCRAVLCGPSGRALLYALLLALRSRAGAERTEVLVPGYTCYSVAAAVVKAGLKLRFYDLQAASFAPQASSLERHCGPHTLAVISQHLLGIPTETESIGAIARRQGAHYILDAAQYLGPSAGLAGADYVLLSFGRGKPLPLGGGGALLSGRHDLNGLLPAYDHAFGLERLVLTAITRFAAHPLLYGIAETLPLGLGQTIFDPSFVVGSVPVATLRLLPALKSHLAVLNRQRRMTAAIYRDSIDRARLVTMETSAQPIYLRFPVLARTGALPRRLRQMGVRRLYPSTLNRESRINAFAADGRQHLPGAESLARQLVTLPTHLGIKRRTAVETARALNQWIDQPPL